MEDCTDTPKAIYPFNFFKVGGIITESHSVSNIQQRIMNKRTTALELTAAQAAGCLNAFYW